jgi:hypothetical protein
VVAAVLLALTCAVTEAASWEVTRKTVIDPINSTFHRHLPSYLRKRDLTALLELYATPAGGGVGWDGARAAYSGAEEDTRRWDGPPVVEAIGERYQRLLALLPAIEKAELRIDRVHWRAANADGYPTDARLLVRGLTGDGARAQLEQHLRWRIAQRDGRWLITHEEVVARVLVTRRTPQYALASGAAGIDNRHTNDASPTFRLFGGGADNPGRSSSGSAVADVDGDGCEDVFLAGSPDIALYRGHCDGTFTDVTPGSGLPRPYPPVATGAVFFDYDNDGRPDLYVAAVAGGGRLFHNQGGRFVEVTSAAGLPADRWGSMGTVADYDRDGWLDLYVVRMGDHGTSVPIPSYDGRNGVGCALFRNRGDGTFADVTRAAGVGFTGWGLAAAWGDHDGDGWPDLYVSNEFGGNALFHNQGDGTFVERASEAGVADGGAGMGVAWGDYDADGDLDLFVSNMHANSGWALFHPDFSAPIPWRYRLLGLFTAEVQRRSDAIIDRLVRGSTLYRNDGGGSFTDVSDAAGVRDGQWGWAAEFLDYDNDGRLDLYAVNGFISGPLLDDV